MSSPPPEIRLGRYQLLRRIGAGGMAEVWRGRMEGPDGFQKAVAIKRVLGEHSSDPEFVRMFVEEAKLVATIRAHPNIVGVSDFGKARLVTNGIEEQAESYYLVMDYVAGQNLAALLNRLHTKHERLPEELALFVTAQAAGALHHAHTARNEIGQPLGIVHRDISPHNLLVSFEGDVRVADFGIAKVANALASTGTGVLKGKLAYMSPEQVSMQRLDGRSDLYALGLSLYEMVCGERLFRGATEDIVAAIVNFDPTTRSEIKACPDRSRAIIERALQPKPDRRYPSGEEMAELAEAALGPGGMRVARGKLAHLAETTFPTEMRMEMEPTPRARSHPAPSIATPVAPGKPDRPEAATRVGTAAEVLPAQATIAGAGQRSVPLRFVMIAGLLLAGAFLLLRYRPELTASPVGVPTIAQVAVTVTPARTPAAPSPTSTAIAVATPASTVRTRPTAKPVDMMMLTKQAIGEDKRFDRVADCLASAGDRGCITLKCSPWANVDIDGIRLNGTTPIKSLLIPAARHTIHFENKAKHAACDTTVDVPRGQAVAFRCDLDRQTVDREKSN